ncbi:MULTISPECIES: biliverdin-producing heme oxygenase [unclassified Rhizobium]|uniref:biliverdin-producing heme oxygenase n=1 Tax=unclassified Rhizobium TaxID=2613769 RepID=UPI003805AA22
MLQRVSPGRRWRLKSATEPHHHRLDALNNQFAMFASVSSYRQYLAATLASRSQLEAMLAAAQIDALVPNWNRIQIVPRLLEDLSDLGGDDPAWVETTGTVIDSSTVIGTLYVLEGSGLGAAILLKRAIKLGMSATFGARHLAQQAANLSSWREMLHLIETTPIDDEDRCERAAIAAFDVFETNYRKVFGNVP